MVKAIAESAMREVVGRTAAEEIRTTGRQAAQDQVRKITQDTLDAYQSGIVITAVNLEKADPPKQVIAAFEEVQRAEQNQAQLINEADQYRNQRCALPKARPPNWSRTPRPTSSAWSPTRRARRRASCRSTTNTRMPRM